MDPRKPETDELQESDLEQVSGGTKTGEKPKSKKPRDYDDLVTDHPISSEDIQPLH